MPIHTVNRTVPAIQVDPAKLRLLVNRSYAWRDRELRKRRVAMSPQRRFTLIRLHELERLYLARYGGRRLPDDDAGRGDLFLAAHTIASLGGDVVQHCVCWARMWARWLPEAEAVELAKQAAANQRRYTADTAARHLGLTYANRTALKITTIGAIDVPKEMRLALRKERKRAAQEKRRRAKGAKPRPVYEAASASRAKPWEAFGVSRRTWERRGKPMPVASACPADNASTLSTHLRHLAQAEPLRRAMSGEPRMQAVTAAVLFGLRVLAKPHDEAQPPASSRYHHYGFTPSWPLSLRCGVPAAMRAPSLSND